MGNSSRPTTLQSPSGGRTDSTSSSGSHGSRAPIPTATLYSRNASGVDLPQVRRTSSAEAPELHLQTTAPGGDPLNHLPVQPGPWQTPDVSPISNGRSGQSMGPPSIGRSSNPAAAPIALGPARTMQRRVYVSGETGAHSGNNARVVHHPKYACGVFCNCNGNRHECCCCRTM